MIILGLAIMEENYAPIILDFLDLYYAKKDSRKQAEKYKQLTLKCPRLNRNLVPRALLFLN